MNNDVFFYLEMEWSEKDDVEQVIVKNQCMIKCIDVIYFKTVRRALTLPTLYSRVNEENHKRVHDCIVSIRKYAVYNQTCPSTHQTRIT